MSAVKTTNPKLEWGIISISALVGEVEEKTGKTISRRTLSLVAKIGQTTLEHIENDGATGISIPTLVKLMRFFSVALGRPVAMSEIIKIRPNISTGPFPYVEGEPWDIDTDKLVEYQGYGINAKPSAIPVAKPWATQLPLFDTSFYRNLY